MKSRLKVDKRTKLDFPKEFDLKKYDICKRWGIDEWSQAIAYRTSFREDWNKSIRKYFDTEEIVKIYGNYKNQACRHLKEPFKYINGSRWVGKTVFIKDQSVADLFEYAEDERLACSSWRSDYLEWSATDCFSLYETDTKKDLVKKIEKTPTWIMKKNEWGQTGVATIHVDLRGRDTEILKDFKVWLQMTRKKMKLAKVPAHFDTDVFSDWCNDRVLPCFDILMYEAIHNGKISLLDIAEALFPVRMSSGDNVTNEDKIRRTIIPNALSVVSSGMATALMSALKKNNKDI